MRQAKTRATRGFTLIELLVVVAIIALLISILLPSLARARELSKRTVCAANMKGIGNGFATYATGNQDDWPIPAHYSATADALCNTTYVYQLGIKRGSRDYADAGETYGAPTDANSEKFIGTTRAFWMMVRSGAASPKSFVCPSSEDQANSEDNPQNYWDFGEGEGCAPGDDATACNASSSTIMSAGRTDNSKSKKAYRQCSYGYQVPFGKVGQPNPNRDQDMALAADKGPYGAWYEDDKSAPGGYAGDQLTTIPGVNSSTYNTTGPNSSSSPDDWRKFNSPNHGGAGDGEGQTVMYPDGHADFSMTPMAGAARDNIYTAWAKTGTAYGALYPDRVQGLRPVARGTTGSNTAPCGQTDSLIYP